ncbi:pyridine nucleotide-disulfide oxidoreductase, class-II [Artemisia annua]|uniref:indole-3-pyruvate monooxygenase n=1 Tax=Artemisia annua TaxID=35608 RepID=A0A2U1NLP4_ARTAN|nr:pyridine nucleotide-disulfide oxidoreductase, class-II [Artemisia annua]
MEEVLLKEMMRSSTILWLTEWEIWFFNDLGLGSSEADLGFGSESAFGYTVIRNKKVLVVGAGNSGMEIALDLSNYGAQTSIVVRSPIHILPRWSVNHGLILLSIIPALQLVDLLSVLVSKLIYGDITKYDLERSSEGPIIRRVRAGIRGGNEALCENGKCYQFDTILFATGFTRSTHLRLQKHARNPVWHLDSGCSRSMTGVKQYLHKYVEEPGPKVVFGDNSSAPTEGYGSVNCNGMLHQFKSINNSLQAERGNGIEKVLTKDNQISFASTRRRLTASDTGLLGVTFLVLANLLNDYPSVHVIWYRDQYLTRNFKWFHIVQVPYFPSTTLAGIEESSQSVGSDSHSDRKCPQPSAQACGLPNTNVFMVLAVVGLESRTSSLQLSLAALICTIWRLRSGIATIIAERGDTTTWRLPLGC